ncbi:MAG: hypothetical protein HY453_01355 [Parcubacteria group bacterium]|nr:hypothetical protein [Parcubacteria group bacterium]
MLQNIIDVVSGFDWTTPSWDLFIILFFVVSSFIYGLSLGRDRILIILVGIYMALAVVNYAPFINDFEGIGVRFQDSYIKITSFVGIFMLLFFFLSRSALANTLGGSDYTGAWWQVLAFSVLHVGLLLSVTLSFLPPHMTNALSPMIQKGFIGDNARFVWIVAPIFVMAISRGRKRDSDYY